MIKIAHFSDIHIFSLPQNNFELIGKRVLGSLNFIFKRSRQIDYKKLDIFTKYIEKEQYDIVLFTGDATTISTAKEFRIAYRYLKRIIKNKNIEFLAIPGNHDTYIKNKKMLAHNLSFYYHLNRKRWKNFPIITNSHGIDFFLSNQAVPNDFLHSNGLFPNNEIQPLNDFIKQNPNNEKIVLGHYPLLDENAKKLSFRRKLKNNHHLQSHLINNKIAFYLCGHIHKPFKQNIGEKSIQISSGSLTLNKTFNSIYYKHEDKSFSQKWIKL